MPNYSLLQLANLQQQKQAPPVLQAIMAAQESAKRATQEQEESELRKLQKELYGTQVDSAKKALEFMPEEQKMKIAQHQANLNQLATNTAATREGMLTEQQRRKMMQDEANIKRHEYATKAIGHIYGLPQDKQQAAFEIAMEGAKNYGFELPKDIPLDVTNAKTRALLEGAYNSSGTELAKLKGQAEFAEANARLAKAQGSSGKDPVLHKAQINNYVKAQDELTKKAAAAEDIINNTNAFLASSKNVPLGTGPMSGLIAPLSSAGQEARKYAGKLAFAEVKNLGGGVVSDADLKAAERNTLSLSNNPEANLKIAKMNIAIAQRAKEEQAFYDAMAEQGVYDRGKIQRLWSSYIKENPIIDGKTGQVNAQNINNWQPYATLDALNGNAKKAEKTASQATDADIDFTAKKYGITPDEVRRRLGM
jgi:hypothetical protein